MICYHATTPENADLIRKTGFRPDSWFAKERWQAESVGGPCVLEVDFPDDVWEQVDASNPEDAPCWQFHAAQRVPASAIRNVIA